MTCTEVHNTLSEITSTPSALAHRLLCFIVGQLSGQVGVWLTFFACFLPISSHANVGRGYLETAHYDPASQVLLLRGWVAPELPNVYTSNVLVSVGGQPIYKGSFLRFERPDVVSSTGRLDWLWSGWELEVNVPRLPVGEQDLQIKFVLTDGQSLGLQSVDSAKSIYIPSVDYPSTKSITLVAIAIFLPALAFIFAGVVSQWTRLRRPEALFAVAVLVSFMCLVASGFSGSSMRLAMKDSPLLVHDAKPWQGDARFIRSDEWNILTQMAIGQVNAPKKFPVINSNVGIDGNNMLIIGMTGVPVSHVSSLAKPATWGFWILDMRSALAWHWWLPFFGCFLALWALMIKFFRLNWRIASVLAISVTASPYSLVFSGHPAYTIFFLALSITVLDSILKTSHRITAIALGSLLGLSLAGFFLVLYLPWQITLIYLMLPVALAHWMSCRQDLIFRHAQIISLIAALSVFIWLISSWLIDTQDVLRIAAATVYPGQRSTSVGGDIDPWFFIKGLMNPLTLYHESSMLSASAAGSFVWIWIPLIAAAGLVCLNNRRIHAVPASIAGFIVVALVYIHIGFPKLLADITMWGRVTSYRLDLALGFAQCLLLAWLISVKGAGLPRIKAHTVNILAQGVAGLCLFLVIWQFGLLPSPISRVLTPGFFIVASLLLGVIAYLLVVGRYEWAAGIYCAWMVGSACAFNPLDQAPAQVLLNPMLKSAIETDAPAGIKPRLAVLDNHRWTMNLVAAGVPTVNGVLYYPQTSLWKSLDPTGVRKTQYNRYQNLEFTTSEVPMDQEFQIDSQRLDMVRVTVDPVRFDFRKFGATHLLTPPETASRLLSNTSIRQVTATSDWVVLKVVSP